MSGAVTATVAVIGAMTVAETFAAIAVVGAVVSVAGMVTKSKELQIAGTVLGAVGGIGSLAVSAGIGGLSAGMTLGEVGGFGPAAAGAGRGAPATAPVPTPTLVPSPARIPPATGGRF